MEVVSIICAALLLAAWYSALQHEPKRTRTLPRSLRGSRLITTHLRTK